DRQHRAACALLDHLLPYRERAVERAVLNYLHHRIEAVVGQTLGRAEEVAGRIVDQPVDAAEPLDRFGDHLLDALGLPHVAGQRKHLDTTLAKFLGGRLEMLRIATGDDEPCAKLAETLRHGFAEASPPARDEDDFVLQESLLEHAPNRTPK